MSDEGPSHSQIGSLIPKTLRSGRTVQSSGSSSRSSSSRSTSSGGSIKTGFSLPSLEEINGDQLPSNFEVLRFFLHLRASNPNMSVSQVEDRVMEEVVRFYVNAKIPMKTKQTIKKKIQNLYKEYKNTKKIYGRRRAPTASEKKLCSDFEANLHDILDISQDNNIIDDENVRLFLENQRKPGRIGSMPNIGRRRKTSKLAERIDVPSSVSELEELTGNVEEMANVDTSNDDVFDDDDDDDVFQDDPKDVDYFQPIPEAQKHKKRIHFVDAEIFAAMDYCKISNPCGTRLLIPTLRALKLDVDSYYISAEYLRRKRMAARGEAFETIQNDFIEYVTKARLLVKIHWDGKAVQNITSRKLDERLVVKAVADDREQIIGMPFSGKKGFNVADSVFNLISDWELNEFVVSLCFDTTYVNSGHLKGAAIRIERMLSRKLQFFPCRHHIYELFLRQVYEHHMGATRSDTVKLFGVFKEHWERIDQKEYTAGISDVLVASELKSSFVDQMKQFIANKLKNEKFRSDYREFLELAMLFLGGELGKKKDQLVFHPPGADHHARWMAKGIYSLKIFMFRHQFSDHLSKEDINGLRQVCIFLMKHYVKAWFRCPLATRAPYQDFNFIRAIMSDKSLPKDLSSAIIKKFSRHLWYLEEETVGLAFFDSTIEIEIKEGITPTNHQIIRL